MNATSAVESSDFFEVAFKDGPLKTTTITVTLILVLIFFAAGYGIIWFEKFGSDKKRTLINRSKIWPV